MLQQTQVARVEPVYGAFLQRFPTVAVLAAATAGEVLTAWSGLGYNRRARDLQRAAGVIVERHAGVVPDSLEALRALPGVGDYTARAVMAFAFGRPCAPVDTNVARVLLRATSGGRLTRLELQALADRTMPPDAPREWSSALMDLGAQICTAATPRCAACPVAPACAWRRAGGPDLGTDPGARVRRRAPIPFAGSQRYHRGRLVAAMRLAPVDVDALAEAADLVDPARLEGLVADLVGEGLAQWHEGRLRLPGPPSPILTGTGARR
jgi:A/G-specific adenine glycosylase